MRKLQYSAYHLNTEEAATAYMPHWPLHVTSLRLFGVETHAFFTAPSAPRDVIALISFGEHHDPEAIERRVQIRRGWI